MEWLNRLCNPHKTQVTGETVSSYHSYQQRLAEYKSAIAPYLDEPVKTEYITDEMIRLCLQSLEERGFISVSESGSFEMYLNMKGGWTPTLAYDADYITNFRKVRAASALIKEISSMWHENYVTLIKNEAITRILKSYLEAK